MPTANPQPNVQAALFEEPVYAAEITLIPRPAFFDSAGAR